METQIAAVPAQKIPSVAAPVWATGRRKTSIARVRVIPSKSGGRFLINNKSVDDYYGGNKRHCMYAAQSLNLAKGVSAYDFLVTVTGGGITGQAEAVRHSIARVLIKLDATLRPILRKEGYLTRDPRAVERKKSGQPGARKRYQYSKR